MILTNSALLLTCGNYSIYMLGTQGKVCGLLVTNTAVATQDYKIWGLTRYLIMYQGLGSIFSL